jgi:hypothetical protein
VIVLRWPDPLIRPVPAPCEGEEAEKTVKLARPLLAFAGSRQFEAVASESAVHQVDEKIARLDHCGDAGDRKYKIEDVVPDFPGS